MTADTALVCDMGVIADDAETWRCVMPVDHAGWHCTEHDNEWQTLPPRTTGPTS